MPRAELIHVHKRFGAVQALRGAELSLQEAEVHALLGENGAGKTTLVRILYGLVRPDLARIELDGREVAIGSPQDAIALGIGLVHQHFMGVPALSVAENLTLGESGSPWLSARALREQGSARLREYGLGLDPDQPASELSVGEQQRLEIVRALSRGARLLILDEPTAVLAPPEVEELLELLARLREEGRTVVLISHKLEEITRVCDRVTVLRDGRTVVTREVEGVDAAELGRLMVGEDPPSRGRPGEPRRGPLALRLRGVRGEGLRGLDLEVHAGEIVALAGIDGNGQGPLEELLAGVRPLAEGEIELLRAPRVVLAGDRQRAGLVLELSLEENLILPDAAASRSGVFERGVLRPGVRRSRAHEAIEWLGIRASPESLAEELSGGNQQKLCVARALAGRPGVIVATNPTRGLDIRSSAFVREELRARAREGSAVLLISTDLDEVLELGQRIGVLFRGALSWVEPGAGRERIGERMLGEGSP